MLSFSDSPSPPAEPPIFVFVGRLVDWKCVDILVHALARMHEDAKLVLVGEGPERPELERLVQHLGLSERVEFCGWLSRSEVKHRIELSRALVLSSTFECGGAVVLEAMAARKPVVATDWGGPADYLDESCGFLIEPLSKESMIDAFQGAMDKLSTDRGLCHTLGAAGRKRIERHYAWPAKIDSILSIYEETLRSQLQPSIPGRE